MSWTGPRYRRSGIDWRAKGLPAMDQPVAPGTVAGLGWNLFDGRFMLPTMVILLDALDHDIDLMASYARDQGVSLAPHGKVTMSPQVWERQLRAGAWAITVATAWQARVAASVGVPRIVIANEVVDEAGLAWLGSLLDTPGPEVVCQVDSVAGVERMASRLGVRSRPLPVLLEMGLPGTRTGLRSLDDVPAILAAIATAPALRIAGVTCYEGVVGGVTEAVRRSQVLELLARVRDVAVVVAPDVARQGLSELIVSGGGSVHVQTVTAELSRPLATELPVRVVIRSGCTVTHDHAGYDVVSPWGSGAPSGDARLQPALEVWAPIISIPEAGLVLAGAGRRDLPFDLGMPTPLKIATSDGVMREAVGIRVTKLDDQHAYLSVEPGHGLSIGDTIGFGVAHPCSAFDRWRFIPVVDDAYDVVDVFETLF